MKIWGNAYMAPWTGLHLMPGTEFKICSVSLALWARASRTELFSWVSEEPITRVTKNDDITHISDCVFILYSTLITQSFHLWTSLIISIFTLRQQCDKLVVVCLLNSNFQGSTFGRPRLSYITKLQSDFSSSFNLINNKIKVTLNIMPKNYYSLFLYSITAIDTILSQKN